MKRTRTKGAAGGFSSQILRSNPIEKHPQQKVPEEGVVVPVGQLDPATLRNLVVEFVTREWSEFGDGGSTLEQKVAQALRQLQEEKC